MPYTFKVGTKVLRKPEVQSITGLSLSSLDRMVKSGEFPKPVKLGSRAVGWPDSVVYDWLNNLTVRS